MATGQYPREYATLTPDKPAAIMAETGEALTYAAMEANSNRLAHLWRMSGLEAGDCIAVMMENGLSWFDLYWSAQRAGLYITPVPVHSTASEAAYIINDSNAKIVVLSKGVKSAPELAQGIGVFAPRVQCVLWSGDPLAGGEDLRAAVAQCPAYPISDETAGVHMTYSSGTTGRPKGIKLPLTGGPADADVPMVGIIKHDYDVSADTIYLSPAPLYHTAPLMFCTAVQRLGGTTVIQKAFDPEGFLKAVEEYKVSFTQLVPTMFSRMLKLPDEVRLKYDLSSLKLAVHAAAPCPVPVKRQMLEWWGPIIHEYYAGSEANGGTKIGPEEWIRKPGSVGRPSWGKIHVCDADGKELPPGEIGTIYFEGGLDFKYHNDPDKTRASRHPQHPSWSAMGDIGYLDEDGYLFLTDRKAFMIISGGVNIYPQEAEDRLIVHPKVMDAAVFGVPNPDFGEEVKAVVQPAAWEDATPAFAEELIAFCREALSPVKCPRSIDFEKELPRAATGKLFKNKLRERYWKEMSDGA